MIILLSELIEFLRRQDGVNDKAKLAAFVDKRFCCIKDRSVYYTADFAVRFCKANSTIFSNTVLSLSALQKYDDRPFVVCICTPSKNYLLMANTTFLSKISHSSKELRIDNIKGSFNGSDIIRDINGVKNAPENFEELFAIHQNYTFEENLERLVEKTNNISPTGKRFDVSIGKRLENIMNSPGRAASFACSEEYTDLLNDLNQRTNKFKNEILAAAGIKNVNLRGRIIEYVITGDDDSMRDKVIDYLKNSSDFPKMVTRNGVGDYAKSYQSYHIETDVKTKIMTLASAPKGYNLDKMLEFLSKDDSVFMLFLVGIDYEHKSIKTKLISIFQETLIANTAVQEHWAGRNSRGVTQFSGEAIKRIIMNEGNKIDIGRAKVFLEKVLLG